MALVFDQAAQRGDHPGRISRVVAAMVVVGWLVSATTIAHAETPGQVGIRPATPGPDRLTSGYFVLHAQAGETLHDSVLVANPGTVPVKVRLYPVDATTGTAGGAVYLNQSDPRHDVGAWITLDAVEIDVPPVKQTTVDFTVVVPSTARNGVHLGGVVAEIENPSPTPVGSDQGAPAGFGITTITRAVTAVVLTVGSAGTSSLKITTATVSDIDGMPTLALTLQNDGSTLIKPHGKVTLTDAKQSVALDRSLAIDTLVPDTTTTYPIPSDSPLPAGPYQVHASLDFGGGAPAVLDMSITIPPVAGATPAVAAGPTHVAIAPVGLSQGAPTGPSPVLLVLGSVAGTLVVVVLGFGAYVRRYRK